MTDIPEDVIDLAFGITASAFLQKHDQLAMKVARALMEARDRALEDARLVVAGWREHDWPEGFSRATAQHMADVLDGTIRAMKSTGREESSQTERVLTDGEEGP